jgi:phosphatidylglycerol:prolipoprotein diacylglycerol transferase
MKPELFKIPIPEFLQGFLPEYLTINSYGLLIAIGILMGFWYASVQAKKQLKVKQDDMINILIILLFAAVIGGKLFVFFESPMKYLNDPGLLIKNFSNGFVFYGSLIFCFASLIIYLRKKKIPIWPMLDIMAVTAVIVHAFGRTGCFFAGCCHGLPTQSFLGVVFTDPHCAASPLNTPLHPTQLYSVFMLVTIFTILIFLKSRKKFHGQLLLVYIVFYAIGRSIIETFRGDYHRGFVIDGIISNSQFISMIMIVLAGVLYFYLMKKKKIIN